MISLFDPILRSIPLVEIDEPFVDLGDAGMPVLADHQRIGVSNPSVHFLKVRQGVAQRLFEAAGRLPPGLRLLIKEGYRPLALQRMYFMRRVARLRELYPSAPEADLQELAAHYAAPPEVGAHPTGAAVDLTLATADGIELAMGSPVNANDELSSGSCYTASAFMSRQARSNRDLLIEVMTHAGFVNYPSEWWHWSYGDRYWAVATGQPHALYGPTEESALAPPGLAA